MPLPPVKAAKPPPRHLEVTVLLIRGPHGTLMRQRTEKLLHGLWTYFLEKAPLSPEEARVAVHNLGYSITHFAEAGTAKHVFTHRVWHMRAYEAAVPETHTPPGYVFVADPASVAMPTALKYFSK